MDSGSTMARRVAYVAGVALLAVGPAACSSDDSSVEGSASGDSVPPAGEPIEVTSAQDLFDALEPALDCGSFSPQETGDGSSAGTCEDRIFYTVYLSEDDLRANTPDLQSSECPIVSVDQAAGNDEEGFYATQDNWIVYSDGTTAAQAAQATGATVLDCTSPSEQTVPTTTP